MTEANNHFSPPVELPPHKPPPCTEACLTGKFELLASRGERCAGDARVGELERQISALSGEILKFRGERNEMSERLSRAQADLVEAVSDPCSAHGRVGRAEYCFGCSAAERLAAALSQERERLAGMFLRTPDVTVTCQLAASIVRYIPTSPPPPLSAGDLEWARAVVARYLADPGPTASIMPEGFTTETGLLLSDPARRT